MLKKDIRKNYMEKRKALSSDKVYSLSESIFDNFLTFFKPVSGQKIHLFLSIQKFNEVDTSFFIEYCFNNGIQVFVPKMVNDDLISIEITPETIFECNSWGIKEPVGTLDSGELHFDYIITPLLYCDSFGNRVGYGKGFYDRLFSTLHFSTKKVGVNYFPPSVVIEDVFENDVPLDYLVLPTEVVSFSTPS